MSVFVISKNGKRLMPTTRFGHVRHLLKDGRAKIYCRKPFAIQLLYEGTENVQALELCIDTGAQHIGISLKSNKRELISEQRDLLKDEKEKHDDCRMYRRTRRNRLRYRKPRFNNRVSNKKDGWFAPSLKNKADQHVMLIQRLAAVAPIKDIYLEVGSFDTQLLDAIAKGLPIQEGTDYQQGALYGEETLRKAVFQRDNYTCQVCGRTIKDGAKLHTHHFLYWKGRHGNRLDELCTVCEKCHTSVNHHEGGKLYGWGADKKFKSYVAAAFMNIVRWYIVNQVKDLVSDTEVHTTYGAATKLARKDLNLEKSHVNDAYSMGKLHPNIRCETEYYKKVRRNNRCLEKFYDAKYIDIRDGKKKSGKELGCQRINRREPRMSEKNLRIYHGQKVSKGRRSIRKQRYSIRPGDVVLFNGQKYISKGCGSYGTQVLLDIGKSVSIKKVQIIRHTGGWINLNI